MTEPENQSLGELITLLIFKFFKTLEDTFTEVFHTINSLTLAEYVNFTVYFIFPLLLLYKSYHYFLKVYEFEKNK